MEIDSKTKEAFLRFQRNEITEHNVYTKLAAVEKNPANQDVLKQIAAEEHHHYLIFKAYTGEDVAPDKWRILKYYLLARMLGVTFALKLMEGGEEESQESYLSYKQLDDLKKIEEEEEKHEEHLIGMINEERLGYMSSVVLGLNDALVEFTGALAGFTLALSDSKMIALTGSITGIAAALSMASSEYLSTKADHDRSKRPVKAAVYTGIAYLITVCALVAPFIFFSNVLIALGVMLSMALLIIAMFNYYYAVARGESFKSRFLEMSILSFSVAAVSFLIGFGLRKITEL